MECKPREGLFDVRRIMTRRLLRCKRLRSLLFLHLICERISRIFIDRLPYSYEFVFVWQLYKTMLGRANVWPRGPTLRRLPRISRKALVVIFAFVSTSLSPGMDAGLKQYGKKRSNGIETATRMLTLHYLPIGAGVL